MHSRTRANLTFLRLLPAALVLVQFSLLNRRFTPLWHFSLVFFLGAFVGISLLSFSLKEILEKTPLPLGRFGAGITANLLKTAFIFALPFFIRSLFNTFAPDTILPAFERLFFTQLFIYFWMAFFTTFSDNLRLLRFELIALVLILLGFFLFKNPAEHNVFQRPFLLALFLFLFISSFLIVFGLSFFAERQSSRQEKGRFIAFAILLPLIIALFGIRPLEREARKQGGGLLQQKLFSFDFAPFLQLESEISMSDDLVFIVHKDPEDQHILMRRFLLSGYNPKKGFYILEDIDGLDHPLYLPEGAKIMPKMQNLLLKELEQEYYIVNFDSRAFVAFKEAFHIIPYKAWKEASFNSVYAVKSMVSEALPFELSDVDAEREGESIDAVYFEYGKDARIAALAQELTEGLESQWERVDAIFHYLHDGDYFYSLKPGLARDGNQLHHFLFEAKKGYCTYYAFAMSLLLRSIGIPSRVAVGFFLDPASATFSYFPVRSDMAHAWVEVYFPDYGWIDYDPTSQTLTPGEEFRFSSGVDPELLSSLMEEILNNRDQLEYAEASEATEKTNSLKDIFSALSRFVRRSKKWLIPLIYILLMLFIRTRYFLLAKLSRRTPRRTPWRLERYLSHIKRRLHWAGFNLPKEKTFRSSLSLLPETIELPLKDLLKLRDRALFGPPSLPALEQKEIDSAYNKFSKNLEKISPLPRRILSWLAPPLLTLYSWLGLKGLSLIFLIISLSFAPILSAEEQSVPSANEQLLLARTAIKDQNWDRALEELNRGKLLFPADHRFPLELGDLYSDKELYSLAWQEYRNAENLSGEDSALLYKLALTAGYLNQETKTVEYLEKVVATEPHDFDYFADLAWAYYKVHRAPAGIALMQDFEEREGLTPTFYMTYGTLYADLYDFAESKKYYEKTIAYSGQRNQRLVKAVAHYNYSILLNRFQHFEESFKETENSIQTYNRPSGHLAKGELLLKRLDFNSAIEDFTEAFEMDSSPLSKISLAEAYALAGELYLAKAWLEEVSSHNNSAWMYNFGTDMDQHMRGIHSISQDIYSGLANELAFKLEPSLWKRLIKQIKKWYWHLLARYHELESMNYGLRSARSWEREGMDLEAARDYYHTFIKSPRRSQKHLLRAQELELIHIPEKAPVYALELTMLQKDASAILSAMEGLHPDWQKDYLLEGWMALAETRGFFSNKRLSSHAAQMAYRLHPGALLQAGIRLPVSYKANSEMGAKSLNASQKRLLKKLLFKAGFRQDPKSNLNLEISYFDGEVSVNLYDSEYSQVIKSATFPLERPSRAALFNLAGEIQDLVFKDSALSRPLP